MIKNFKISTSTESELDIKGNPTGKEGRVMWLHFKTNSGKMAGLNLNNIASDRGGIVGSAIREFIDEYEES